MASVHSSPSKRGRAPGHTELPIQGRWGRGGWDFGGTILYRDKTRAGEGSEGWVEKGRKFREARAHWGVSLGLGSRQSSGVTEGGAPPNYHARCVHTCAPPRVGLFSWGGDWVLLPHLREMLSPSASQRCGFAMRISAQAGEHQAWYGWGFCSRNFTGRRPAPQFLLPFRSEGTLSCTVWAPLVGGGPGRF